MNKRARIEDYMRWLEPQIRDNPEKLPSDHRDLMELMQAKQFVWLVPNDDNRVQDGLDLREEFCHDHKLRLGSLSHIGPCSFLEVLIGLSRRLEFAAGGTAPGWAWQLIHNLELAKFTDPLPPRKIDRANEIMDAVIWRRYQPDGGGGFFPLIDADDDQTQIELWYQMAAYIHEIHPEY